MTTAGTIYEVVRDKINGCGVLRYVGPKALSYLPFNGNKLKINAMWRSIPASGIVGLDNTASCFVNGTAGQALAANQFYYVYAFMNGSVMTAEFANVAHVTDLVAGNGNEGVEIKTGDNTRSLIGMVKTNASSNLLDTVTDRMVRTWFNRKAQQRTFGSSYTAQQGTVSTGPIELSTTIRSRFLVWKDETLYATVTGSGYTSGDGYACYWQLGWDGLATDGYHATGFGDSPVGMPMSMMFADTKAGAVFAQENAEHYVTLVCWTGYGFYVGWTSAYLVSVTGCIIGGE